MSGDIIHASVGATMLGFTFDAEAMHLTPCGQIELPSRVRYACAHPVLPVLYAACGPGDVPNVLCALRRDEGGHLHWLGDPVPLPTRPMEVTCDLTGGHIVVSYDTAPGLSVHRLGEDGGILDELARVEPFEAGFKTHSAAILPSNMHGVMVALGQRGFGQPKYVEGRLGVFSFASGKVEALSSMSPPATEGMAGFNPRNLALHPTLPLGYISIEGQNMLGVIRCGKDRIEPRLLHVRSVLADPDHVRKRQNLGAILPHPAGHALYLANRNDGYVDGHAQASWLNPDPIPVFPGGENSIVVFHLDPLTGEPTLAQHIDAGGLHPRTISLNRQGTVLMVGNCAPTRLATGEGIVDVPAGLVFFRVAPDGTLAFAHRHAVDVGAEKMWWSQIV